MRTPRQVNCHTPTKPYVVLVTYPGSSKEYAYWCDLQGVDRGTILQINNAACYVRQIRDYDSRATKWVPSSFAVQSSGRREEIMKRLAVIESFEARIARYMKLKSPEAKKLVAELRKLNS